MVRSPGLLAEEMLPYSCFSQSKGESQDSPINSQSLKVLRVQQMILRGAAQSAQPTDKFTEQKLEKPDSVSWLSTEPHLWTEAGTD